MHVLPQLPMNGIYLVFIGCYAFGLLFLPWASTAARGAGTGRRD